MNGYPNRQSYFIALIKLQSRPALRKGKETGQAEGVKRLKGGRALRHLSVCTDN